MSYCLAGQSAAQLKADHWISVRNWNRLIAFHPPAQALPAAASGSARAAGEMPLGVIATVDSAGSTSIFEVEPGQVTPARATAASPPPGRVTGRHGGAADQRHADRDADTYRRPAAGAAPTTDAPPARHVYTVAVVKIAAISASHLPGPSPHQRHDLDRRSRRSTRLVDHDVDPRNPPSRR